MLRGGIGYGVRGLALLTAACGAPSTDDVGTTQSALTIASLEVNQALGVQYNGAKKFVAGKNTAIIAYLDAPVAVDDATQTVVIKLGTTTVATLTPDASAAPTDKLVFQCPTRDKCGNWVEGDYTFEAKIGDQTSTASAKFVKRRGLRILAVPIKVSYGKQGGGTEVLIPDTKWKKSVEFVKATFPVAPDDVQWIVRDTLDLSALDANTDDGRYKIWQALTDLNPPSCAANKTGPECYDVVSGFVKARMSNAPGEAATLQGYTYALPGVVSVNDDDDLAATVAHEISHPFGIGDEYQGGQFNCDVNPVPAAYVGKDFNDGTKDKWSCAASTETAPPEALGTGVLVAAAKSHPFDTTGGGLLGDVAGYMGSGAPQKAYWVQPRVFDRLFDQLAPREVKGNAGVNVVGVEASITKDAQAPKGYSADLEPLFTFDGIDPGTTTPGEWYARALGATDNVLSSANGTVDFSPNIEPPTDVKTAAMRASLLLPAGAKKIQIMHNTDVIKELTVTPNAPVVTFTTGISAGQTLSGTTDIAWTMSDADNDALKAVVEYSSDNKKTWSVVGDDLEEPKLTLDWDELAGGAPNETFVRVVVTDGVNTSVALSPGFTVAPKKPDVYIETEPGTFKTGDSVGLSGAGEDLTGDLDESQLAWTSDLDGALGKGSNIFVKTLKPGTHVITLTGTNGSSVANTATVAITITAKADTGSPDSGTPSNPQTTPAAKSGCGCHVVEPQKSWDGGLLAALLGSVALLRRRSRKSN